MRKKKKGLRAFNKHVFSEKTLDDMVEDVDIARAFSWNEFVNRHKLRDLSDRVSRLTLWPYECFVKWVLGSNLYATVISHGHLRL